MDFVASFPLAVRLREPLAAALRGQPWPESLTAMLTEDEVRAIVEHGMAPIVYANAHLPQFRREAIRAAALEPVFATDLSDVLNELAVRGVETLIMKGTALAYDLYAAPELRPRSDTDLLIRPSSLPILQSVMRELGFEEHLGSGDEHGLRQMGFTRHGMSYDVHWAATNVPVFDAVLRFDDLLPRSIALPLLGPHARGFSHVDALLMACVHRVAHHHDSERLIWLADIVLLRDRMTREEHGLFWRLAAQGGVVAVCVRSIAVADAWLSGPPHDLADEWLSAEELSRREPSAVFIDRDITRAGVMVSSLRALPWRARIERIWQLAFPPAAFMQHTFGTRNRLILPFLYLYRGLRGLARLFGKAGR